MVGSLSDCGEVCCPSYSSLLFPSGPLSVALGAEGERAQHVVSAATPTDQPGGAAVGLGATPLDQLGVAAANQLSSFFSFNSAV